MLHGDRQLSQDHARGRGPDPGADAERRNSELHAVLATRENDQVLHGVL